MTAERVEFEKLLASVLAQLNLDLEPCQINQLFEHQALLQRWNYRISLTSVQRLDESVFRHFGESLAVAKVIGSGSGAVVDVGSGAGFPGCPVAVSLPDRMVTLVESVGKKASFLKEIARNVGNIRVENRRFEDLQGQFEWGTMRAVAAIPLKECLNERVENAAVLVSASAAASVAAGIGLLEAAVHPIPWDARTVVLSGLVSRGT